MPRKKVSYDHEDSALISEETRTEEKVKPWDRFKNTPVKIETGSMEESKHLDRAIIVVKLITYLVTFIMVLGAAVVSKGTLLFMTSQIQPNVTRPYCKDLIDRNKEFVVQLPRVERTAWIWIIMFTYFVPEALTFLRSVRMSIFKTWRAPTIKEYFSIVLTETLPAVGSALLVFTILPELDVVKGAMLTNAVCFVPSVLGYFSRGSKEDNINWKFTLDIISILAQLSAFILWPIIEKKTSMWLIPVSILFISCGWWENYVSDNSPINFLKNIGKIKKTFENSRYIIYIFVSVWKCLVFFVTTIIIIYVKEQSVSFLFTDFYEAFSKHTINITEVKPVIGDQTSVIETIFHNPQKQLPAYYLAPVWVFLINIACTYICYAFAKFSCKIFIQGFGYAFPVNLAVPTTISLLIAICGIRSGNPCVLNPPIPLYLFFNSPPLYFLNDFITSQHTYFWIFWLLSQTWITIHMWTPRCERLARTEKLFVKPMYDAFLIDQSIALNRRRDDEPEKLYESDKDMVHTRDNTNNAKIIKESTTTKVYACACMWHETEEEIKEFLKSIFRLDEDQCARRIVTEDLDFELPDYFELETHIFFDDAFIRKDKDDENPTINQYVKNLVQTVNKAATEVHRTDVKIRPPKKFLTPYGGRLEWTLPGKTIMIAHLKDIKKIRTKKRWSQVMYMYYLFGHRLMEREDLTANEKDIMSENTYILALDGDMDFQPNGLHLLVDLMKKNKTLGAACGRIHPLGSGPMVWYQMFEYAVGHWLQKATEHMIGCVLCSPGCFSLFRAKALMDDGIMLKYASKSQEARQFVQYDQGEDRWLCTLLLQRGYRVEYSAASDAYTHCPEGFNEFYNQRRRWMPSTTANILDLLMDYKRTVRINDNISFLYIVYQMVLMVGSVLGPGTIFLMLVGAFVAAFQLDQWTSFLWNVIPILFYMIICILFKSDVQLFVAGILSALYGLVMMAVLVGVMLQISADGILAPSSLFFFCIAGEMIFTALMHPKELICLLYGVVYYITVPSMYMLLVIYSVFNLNNISWGTREVTVIQKEKQNGEEGKKQKPKNKVLSLFGSDKKEDAGTFEFSVGGLFKCLFCTHSKGKDENKQLTEIMKNIQQLTEKVQLLDKSLNKSSNDIIDKTYIQQPQRRPTILEGSKGKEVGFLGIDNDSESDRKSLISDIPDDDDLPNWTEDEALGKGHLESLFPKEKMFWEGLINKYLYPYEDDKQAVTQKLKDLRDKSVMAFFMINAIFVLVIFLLTLKKDLLHIDWPLDIKYNFTYLGDRREVQLTETPLELEPIGIVFLVFFFSLLLVQFIAMLFHRFSTFSQILSTTYINWNFLTPMSKDKLTVEEILARNPVKVVKKCFKLKGTENDNEDDDDEDELEQPIGRRKTVQHLAESGHKRTSITDLLEAYERRLDRLENTKDNDRQGRKSMLAAVNKRRSTVKYRKSVQFKTNAEYDNSAYISEF